MWIWVYSGRGCQVFLLIIFIIICLSVRFEICVMLQKSSRLVIELSGEKPHFAGLCVRIPPSLSFLSTSSSEHIVFKSIWIKHFPRLCGESRWPSLKAEKCSFWSLFLVTVLNFMGKGADESVSIHHLLFLVLSLWNRSTNPSEPVLIYCWQLIEI